ncbi:outer membrane OmpA family protein [Beggiatoa sp. PS]|nr:outer membrane OmpA family protein [Beggiatoa sp. PS]
MADTCNKVDATRGRAEVILPKVEPGTTAAYQALFLNSQGIIMAAGAKRGQNASGDQNGGFFTQGFLTSLKTELESPHPSWDTIMANTKEWVQEQKPSQIPQTQVAIQVIGNNIGDDNEYLPPLPSEPTVTTRKLTVDQFDTNSAELKPFHKSQLQQWEQGLTSSKSLTPPSVRVEGHTDSRGTDENNMTLSERRATSVKKHLVEELGASSDRFDIIPYGESQLTASEETEEGRALNRRVEIVPELPMVAANNEEEDIQSPQKTISANTDNDDNNQASLPFTEPLPTIESLRICPEPSSSFGSCYWKKGLEENQRKWSIFFEEKLWFNTWTGWFYNSEEGHFIAATTELETAHLLTLGGRYDKFSLAFTFLPEYSYDFPTVGTTNVSADRQEEDVTLSYSLMPELQVGVGFKRVKLDYIYQYSNNTTKEGHYKIYGPTLNIGSQVCLANFIGANISLFGSFSYGFLKTKWSDNDNDYTRYHSADLGVSWELPKIQQFKPEIRFGYRAQTIYTEIPAGDGVDATEGFTLGLRVTF